MHKCFLVCLFALILQSVHKQFVDLIGKKKSVEENTSLKFFSQLYVGCEFPALVLAKFSL